MTTMMTVDAKWLLTVLAAIFMAISAPDMALKAQGIKNQEAVDKIIGSKVEEDESLAEKDASKISAAIEKTRENIPAVRKMTKIGKVDIVFLPDAAPSEGGPPPDLAATIKEHEPEVKQLRTEIEGNAMLFHAINSRQILVGDVLALEFSGEDSVTIYAAAKLAR